MNKNFRRLALSILTVSVLTACGGGGTSGGSGTTGQQNTVSATAISAIQTLLNTWQNKFATTLPLPNDPALLALLDTSFLQDGDGKSAFFSGNNIINNMLIGLTFTAPIAVSPADTGAVANDASHQWFTTTANGMALTMLATKNAAGNWLLAGNQRQIGVSAYSFANLNLIASSGVLPTSADIASAVAAANSAGTVGIIGSAFVSSYTSLSLFLNSITGQTTLIGQLTPLDTALLAKGVTTATVSGPGLIGSTSGVLGTVPLFVASSVAASAVVGTLAIPNCSLLPASGVSAASAVATNCLDMTKVTAGTYSFNISGATPPAVSGVAATPFSYTYNEPFTAVLPASLTPAMFPTISSVTPNTAAGFISGVNATLNWIVPAAQTAVAVFFGGYDANFTSLFNVNMGATGGAGATLASSTTLPAFASAVSSVTAGATSVDTKGVTYQTFVQY